MLTNKMIRQVGFQSSELGSGERHQQSDIKVSYGLKTNKAV